MKWWYEYAVRKLYISTLLFLRYGVKGDGMVVDPISGFSGVGAEQLQPLIDSLGPFLSKLSLFFGGIFGLYLIYVVAGIYYERKRTKILEDMRFDLDQMNIHYNIPYSKHRPGFFKRVFRSVKSSFTRNSGGEEL